VPESNSVLPPTGPAQNSPLTGLKASMRRSRTAFSIVPVQRIVKWDPAPMSSRRRLYCPMDGIGIACPKVVARVEAAHRRLLSRGRR
jgi:hypothetical protein